MHKHDGVIDRKLSGAGVLAIFLLLWEIAENVLYGMSLSFVLC